MRYGWSMSADIRLGIALITGSEPTADQIQRVMAIAHALDMPQSDPLLPFLAALESYRSVIASAPEAMERAAAEATSAAITRAEENLAATIERTGVTMERVARDSINRVMSSHVTRWLAGACGFAIVAVGIVWLVVPSSRQLGRLLVRQTDLEQRVVKLQSNVEELRETGGDAQLAWCSIPHWVMHDERIRCVRVDTRYGPFSTSAGAIYYPIFGYAPK